MSDKTVVIDIINSDPDSNSVAMTRLQKRAADVGLSLDDQIRAEIRAKGFDPITIVWWDFGRRVSCEARKESA